MAKQLDELQLRTIVDDSEPTTMTDVTATKLGKKVYEHGGSYNGGGAPTITLESGGGTLSTVNASQFIPYQMQDGSWRMKFFMSFDLSSTARTTIEIGVNDVVNGAPGLHQPYEGYRGADITYRRFNTSNNFQMTFNSSSTTSFAMSGDVIIDAKPTWAY